MVLGWFVSLFGIPLVFTGEYSFYTCLPYYMSNFRSFSPKNPFLKDISLLIVEPLVDSTCVY
jgi:hypothetical protein